MFTTKKHSRITVWEPRSFTGLMALYESNFLRLKRLLGGILPRPDETMVSHAVDEMDLHLAGLYMGPYTTTLRLTYLFEENGVQVPDPNLLVRIYHDAHLAEAMQCAGQPRNRILRGFVTDRGGELERRWARNLLLNKWLAYCHEQGHRFGPVSLRVIEPVHAGLR